MYYTNRHGVETINGKAVNKQGETLAKIAKKVAFIALAMLAIFAIGLIGGMDAETNQVMHIF